MVAEIGGLAVRERDVQRGVDGVLSVLRHEGVIDGEEIRRDDQVVCDYIAHIDPHEGGLMVPGLDISKLGEIVEGREICMGCFTGKYPMEPPAEDIRGEFDR